MATASQPTPKPQPSPARNDGEPMVDERLRANVQSQMDALRSDIAELTRAVGALAQDTTDRAHSRASRAAAQGRQMMDDFAHEARDRAMAAGDDAYEAGRYAARRLKSNVQHRPLTAVAVAAGIGFVLGSMSSSRR